MTVRTLYLYEEIFASSQITLEKLIQAEKEARENIGKLGEIPAFKRYYSFCYINYSVL